MSIDKIKRNTENVGFNEFVTDENLFDASMQGRTIFDIDADSSAFSALQQIIGNKLSLKTS